MTGKIVFVSGSTDGIGKETALELAEQGATVLMHGRNAKKGIEAMNDIRKSVPKAKLDFFVSDFSSLNAIRRLVVDIRQKYDKLDVLLNNAGVFMKQRELTNDGFEMTFAVNHLAPFLLTHLCLPLLKSASPSRVVTVSSIAHNRGMLNFDNLNGEIKFDGYGAYSLSKLANVLFALELAERVKADGITSNTLHPGVITTKLLETGFSMKGNSLQEGAETSVYLASSPEVANITGKYFFKKRPQAHNPVADNLELRKRFWAHSEKLVGLS